MGDDSTDRILAAIGALGGAIESLDGRLDRLGAAQSKLRADVMNAQTASRTR